MYILCNFQHPPKMFTITGSTLINRWCVRSMVHILTPWVPAVLMIQGLVDVRMGGCQLNGLQGMSKCITKTVSRYINGWLYDGALSTTCPACDCNSVYHSVTSCSVICQASMAIPSQSPNTWCAPGESVMASHVSPYWWWARYCSNRVIIEYCLMLL